LKLEKAIRYPVLIVIFNCPYKKWQDKLEQSIILYFFIFKKNQKI